MPIFLWGGVSLVLSAVLGFLGTIFSTVAEASEITDSFECGIDPVGSCRVPIALHFFLVAVVFVLFDGELLVSLPMVYPVLGSMYSSYWLTFLVLLYLGLVLEILLGTVEWNE